MSWPRFSVVVCHIFCLSAHVSVLAGPYIRSEKSSSSSGSSLCRGNYTMCVHWESEGECVTPLLISTYFFYLVLNSCFLFSLHISVISGGCVVCGV